jgi:hypothetical protein
MGIPLVEGREFTARDTADAPKVAIVSERIVREYFPGGPGGALGRRVRLEFGGGGEWLTVVGVVADIRQMGLDRNVQPMIYLPFQQERRGFIRFVSFVARTNTPGSVAEGIRAEIRRAAPDLPIETTRTMDEAVAASVAPPRFRMVLLVLFATTATLIATCGIYGLMAYAVTQRRREIGVRMALGAERRDVLRLVLTRALRIVVAGVIVGLAGAVSVTRVLQRFLFGVTPTDPIAFTIVTLLLMAVGLVAAWLPARRATRIDPCAALRAENPSTRSGHQGRAWGPACGERRAGRENPAAAIESRVGLLASRCDRSSSEPVLDLERRRSWSFAKPSASTPARTTYVARLHNRRSGAINRRTSRSQTPRPLRSPRPAPWIARSWSGLRESNPSSWLGKPEHYHYAKPATTRTF